MNSAFRRMLSGLAVLGLFVALGLLAGYWSACEQYEAFCSMGAP